jgi:hypothetical protein
MEVMFQYCIRRIPQTILGRVTSCYDWKFSWFASIFPGVWGNATFKWVTPYLLTVVITIVSNMVKKKGKAVTGCGGP